MNAYDLSEKKNKIIISMNYLEREKQCNNTDTVLLTNDEVNEIIKSMQECVDVINLTLSKITVF